jgi:alanyl-tRNA synthetase
MVNSERLRFDYTHGRALSSSELAAVEDWVNQAALQSVDVQVHQTDYQDAMSRLKALALFSEKYGDTVRVVKVSLLID